MRKRVALMMTVILFALAGVLVLHGNSVDAAKKGPLGFDIVTKVDLTEQTVKDMLLAGWSLGGVYPDCGVESGEITVAFNLAGAMLPFYKELQKRNEQEILALLKKQFPRDAEEKLKKILAGKDKVTNYGGTDEYVSLQNDFDQLQVIVKELEEASASGGTVKIDDLVAKLEKFASSGNVSEINSAKKVILALQTIIEKEPEQLLKDSGDTSDGIARLEKIRKAVGDAMARINQLGGSACKMTFVFYKAK